MNKNHGDSFRLYMVPGKSVTTMISQLVNEVDFPVNYISADGVVLYQNYWIEQQWETTRLKLKISGKKEGLLVIDEVQKIKNRYLFN